MIILNSFRATSHKKTLTHKVFYEEKKRNFMVEWLGRTTSVCHMTKVTIPSNGTIMCHPTAFSGDTASVLVYSCQGHTTRM